MAGNSTAPKFEIPQSYELTVAAPIDTRYTADSNLTSVLATQVPVSVRYAGLLVWVNRIYNDPDNEMSSYSEGGYIYFKPNYEVAEPYKSDELIPTVFSGSGSSQSNVFTSEIKNIAADGQDTVVMHNLGVDNITVQASIWVDDSVMQPIELDWEHDNSTLSETSPNDSTSYFTNSRFHAIRFRTRLPIDNLRLLITGAVTEVETFVPTVPDFTLSGRIVQSPETLEIRITDATMINHTMTVVSTTQSAFNSNDSSAADIIVEPVTNINQVVEAAISTPDKNLFLISVITTNSTAYTVVVNRSEIIESNIAWSDLWKQQYYSNLANNSEFRTLIETEVDETLIFI